MASTTLLFKIFYQAARWPLVCLSEVYKALLPAHCFLPTYNTASGVYFQKHRNATYMRAPFSFFQNQKILQHMCSLPAPFFSKRQRDLRHVNDWDYGKQITGSPVEWDESTSRAGVHLQKHHTAVQMGTGEERRGRV
jgi:hypothetical protein